MRGWVNKLQESMNPEYQASWKDGLKIFDMDGVE